MLHTPSLACAGLVGWFLKKSVLHYVFPHTNTQNQFLKVLVWHEIVNATSSVYNNIWGSSIGFNIYVSVFETMLDGWHAALELGARGVWMGGTRLWRWGPAVLDGTQKQKFNRIGTCMA